MFSELKTSTNILKEYSTKGDNSETVHCHMVYVFLPKVLSLQMEATGNASAQGHSSPLGSARRASGVCAYCCYNYK